MGGLNAHEGIDAGCRDCWRFGLLDPTGRQAVAELEGPSGDGEGHFSFSVWGDGRALCLDSGSAPLEADGEVRRIGPLSVERLPGEAWRVAYDGQGAVAEINWSRLSDRHEWSSPRRGDSQTEQSGLVEGLIRVGDDERPVAGFGQRVHSRGARRIELAEHGWLARVFHGDDFYSQHAIVTVGGRDRMFGYLCRDGVGAPLAAAEVAISHAYSGGPPLLASIELEDATGRRVAYDVAKGGSVVSAIEPAAAGFVTRHLSFPTFSADGVEGVGEIEHWFSDPDLVRPHLAMTAVAAGAR